MMAYIWLALVVVFGVLEAITAQLVSIWFVIGCVAALCTYFLGASVLVQTAVFVAVSALVLLLTRPFVRKITMKKFQPTNADSFIGLDAVVTKTIDNIRAVGTVKVKGVEWTARSESPEIIEEGEIVTVKSIEGVKLIVERKI